MKYKYIYLFKKKERKRRSLEIERLARILLFDETKIESERLERKRLENEKNKITEKLIRKNERGIKNNSEGDLAVVLYSVNGTTPDELNIRKDEYIIVTNWNVGNGYAYGYKRNDPQKKGKFPLPLVRKCTEKEGIFFFFKKNCICNINKNIIIYYINNI